MPLSVLLFLLLLLRKEHWPLRIKNKQKKRKIGHSILNLPSRLFFSESLQSSELVDYLSTTLLMYAIIMVWLKYRHFVSMWHSITSFNNVSQLIKSISNNCVCILELCISNKLYVRSVAFKGITSFGKKYQITEISVTGLTPPTNYGKLSKICGPKISHRYGNCRYSALFFSWRDP